MGVSPRVSVFGSHPSRPRTLCPVPSPGPVVSVEPCQRVHALRSLVIGWEVTDDRPLHRSQGKPGPGPEFTTASSHPNRRFPQTYS